MAGGPGDFFFFFLALWYKTLIHIYVDAFAIEIGALHASAELETDNQE